MITLTFALSFLVAAVFVGGTLYSLIPAPFPKNAPTYLRGYPILGSLQFFTARWELFKNARNLSKTGNFSFHVGPHQLLGLSGQRSREFFFTSPDLSFSEGYAILFAMSPTIKSESNNKTVTAESGFSAYFAKRLTALLRKETLQANLPNLLGDTIGNLDTLGPSGITDPFESIYNIVFQLTLRTVGSKEIAEDRVKVQQMAKWFDMFEKSSTTTTLLFPRFPSISKAKRIYSAGRIYMTLQSIINDRKKTGRSEEDPLQHLIDQGDSVEYIIQFLIGSLFAGILNSGINAAYLLCYLATNPEWTAKVREEVVSVAAKYASNTNLPLEEQMLQIPSEAWEQEFPLLDMCLKDSIRLNLHGTAFRRNVSGKKLMLDNEAIPNGSFVTYHIGDIHQDPSIYEDPTRWDPSRYLPERSEHTKVPFAWAGWGMGRHPCLGMRFAKLESNIICAFWVARYDAVLLDHNKQRLGKAPKPDFNAWSASKPKDRLYLRYQARAVVSA